MAAQSGYPPANGITVVSPHFLAPYPVDLTIVKKLLTLSDGNFAITDVNGNVMFKVKGKHISLRDRRVLLDAAGNPILSFQKKLISVHNRWVVFRGDSSDSKDLIFTAKQSSLIQLKTSLDVFLGYNDKENVCDFKVKGSWFDRSCTIYAGDGATIIAQSWTRDLDLLLLPSPLTCLQPVPILWLRLVRSRVCAVGFAVADLVVLGCLAIRVSVLEPWLFADFTLGFAREVAGSGTSGFWFIESCSGFGCLVPCGFFWFFSFAMAEDGKFRIEKFNGTDFAWWRMQIEALLGECDLDVVLEEKPAGMDKAAEAIWNSKDKKARGKITLALTRSVAFNIMKETTARDMLEALSNMYEKPSAGNRVFLMRELFNMRMNEGSSVADHINEVNSILSRLATVGMKLDDDTQAVVLLSSLPDSWSGFVTTVTETAGTGNLKFDRVRDSVLGEDVRRRNTSGGSTSGMLSVSRGRGKNRSSGSRGKSFSKAGKNVRCWNCGEKGHVKNECPNPKKEDGKQHVNSVVSDESDGDVLLCCEESIDSWAMDSGSSFHTVHSGETMVNLKKRDFGKVRLANGHVLNVTGMGDVNLKTPLGTTWNLKNVRIIPGLTKKLISVSQLDKQGLDVKFGGGKWKVIDGNLVVACGRRRGSLYLVEIPAEGVAVPVQHKVWFTESSKRKRVQFANLNPGALGMSVECGRGSKFKPVRGFGDSGSMGRVSGTTTKNRWVLKTKIPTEEKSSPGNSLQNVKSGINSRCISGAGGSCKPVEIENGSNKTVGLELVGASTGLSVT
uniref:Putative zinc finger, CCHC-type, Tubby C-terminal-like domain protein n=1 Tax=Helianthus annuus TaxID=4232 RepID=A0A251S4W8_HELAN